WHRSPIRFPWEFLACGRHGAKTTEDPRRPAFRWFARRRDSPDARAWVERPEDRIYQRWFETWDRCAMYQRRCSPGSLRRSDKFFDTHLMGVVLDEQRITPIVEKPGKFFRERQLRIELAQQQKARVAGDLTPIKIENDLRLKTKPELIMTLCSHRSSVCCERLVW